ncbi:TRAP transporter small permease subunit [Anaerobacillus alkaliphilus]|uniref:TRAP transporter small permease subunit n=1 Tax=Anaerobacillus alkaliphilus TaxID=1548597 RepID=A0A4Q0VSA6_9BACI|nr:TRAP transporter small permease subunit [Anaerobacillus alkaliphilus]RXJ00679.1 TRAP transporter small permease subunit [Anaerobacillus alkaliphilus]
MKPLLRVFSYVDKFHEFVAKTTAWLILVLIFTMTYEVASRYLFNNPTVWSYDLSYFLSSLFLMFGMAYTMSIKGHVNIDIFYGNFSPRVKAACDVGFALLLFFPLWYLIIATMIPHVQFSINMNEKSSFGSWFPIIWPYKLWILTGLILLFIQGIVEFSRDLIWLIKGGERP